MNDEIKEILDYLKNKELYCTINGIEKKMLYQTEADELSDYIINLQQEMKDYKSRCEKAIEYINERKNLNWYADGVFVEELLNILNGGDEE